MSKKTGYIYDPTTGEHILEIDIGQLPTAKKAR
jgi:hypothetical protein